MRNFNNVLIMNSTTSTNFGHNNSFLQCNNSNSNNGDICRLFAGNMLGYELKWN